MRPGIALACLCLLANPAFPQPLEAASQPIVLGQRLSTYSQVLEQERPDWVYLPPSYKPLHEAGIARFRDLLTERGDESLRVGYRFYEDKTHMSVPLIALCHGLLFAHEGYAQSEP